MKALLSSAKIWAGRAVATLGVAGLVAGAAALLFAGGELRNAARAACGARDAGWLTRHVCDWLDVVPPPPVAPVELADSDQAESAERYVAPSCTTAQALEILDEKASDVAALERLLQRDLDGDGRTGSATRRPRPAPAAGTSTGFELDDRRGELILADKTTPELPRGGRVVTTVPVAGGPVRQDVIPNEVPDAEWLHELTWRVAGDLPVNDHEWGDGLEASVLWDIARGSVFRFGLEPYGEKLDEEVASILGKDFDWGAKAVISVKCRGLTDCRAQ